MTQPPAAMSPNPWDEAPAVEETPWENAPEVSLMDESLASPNQPVPDHPAARLASGMVRGGINAVNPFNIAKAAYALGKMGVKTALNPSSVFETGADIARGVKETGAAALGQRGPEAAGEVYGGLLAAPVPYGRIGAGIARNVPLFRATEASRAYNIRRALRIPGGTSEKVQKLTADVNAMTPEIDLPVAVRHRTMARKLTEARQAAGARVGAAEAALPVSDIPVADVTRRIEMPPGQWASRNGVLEFVPDDPAAMAAYREAIDSLESAAGDAGALSTPDMVRLKHSAQKAAREKRAYESLETTQAKGVARAKASALRASLEDVPGSDELVAANRAAHVAKTIEKPAVAEATRLSNLPPLSRGAEILLGRAGGARSAGPIGAAVGLAGGQLLDSTLFHTASAAVKRRVIDALQSGQPQLATQILYEAGVAQSINRRSAEAALRAQGEGVTTP